MRNLSFLLFVAVTFCCWGVYGPLLHVGQAEMGADGQLSSLRPFICVGIAYFLIAVLFPIFILFTKKETGHWSATGIIWSFIAGVVGAVGALGIILAFKFGGKPVYVMPIVFGCAPVVNTLVTMWMSRTVKNASLMFYIAIATVAIGAAGVLFFKPSPPKPATAVSPPTETPATSPTNAEQSSAQRDSTEIQTTDKAEPNQSKTTEKKSPAKKVVNLFYVFLCIGVTAICWGAYGPVLHKGQAKMGGSRLRPFLCVGIAYFAIAVIVPYFLLDLFPEPGGWTVTGSGWSLLAGAAGAIGALGIIYAFNFGGKPIFVMPLVFGFAPVVNTLTETVSKGLFDQLTSLFYLSLALVILGAVTVLICAPRGKPPAKQNTSTD